MQDRGYEPVYKPVDPLERLIQAVEVLAANQVKLTESVNGLVAQLKQRDSEPTVVTAGPLAYLGGRPVGDHDRVVAWYGPDIAVTRRVMDMTFNERKAPAFTLEFPTVESIPLPIGRDLYREKSMDTGYQVFLLMGFALDRTIPGLIEAVDNWVFVERGPRGIVWSSLRSNDERASGIIVDGPT
jgi:hypothetical protein